MDTVQEHRGEPERRDEGLGERVRRFVDSELSHLLDKEAQTPTEHPGKPDPEGHGQIADGAEDSRTAPETRAHEPQPTDQPPQASDSEPAVAYTGGHIDLPAKTAAPDAGPEPGLQPAGSDEVPGRFEGQAAADDSAARVGLLSDAAGLRDQWQQVQGTFVDDSQRAVHEASMLVEQTLDELRVNITRGHTSATTSTEDLRISFQRYREFFQRLLSA